MRKGIKCGVLNADGICLIKNLAKSLDMVNDAAETLIVSRSKGKNVVVVGLAEYNSMV